MSYQSRQKRLFNYITLLPVISTKKDKINDYFWNAPCGIWSHVEDETKTTSQLECNAAVTGGIKVLQCITFVFAYWQQLPSHLCCAAEGAWCAITRDAVAGHNSILCCSNLFFKWTYTQKKAQNNRTRLEYSLGLAKTAVFFHYQRGQTPFAATVVLSAAQ